MTTGGREHAEGSEGDVQQRNNRGPTDRGEDPQEQAPTEAYAARDEEMHVRNMHLTPGALFPPEVGVKTDQQRGEQHSEHEED